MQNKFLAILSVPIACVFGILSLMLTSSDSIKLLVGLPALLALTILFAANRSFFMKLLIALRASLDPVIVSARILGLGLGFVLNITMIIYSYFSFISLDKVQKSFIWKSWFALLLVFLISQILSNDVAASLRIYINFMACMSLFVIGMAAIKKQSDIEYWLKIILLSGLIPVLITIPQKFLGSLSFYTQGLGDFGRVSGTFGHPNVMGFYCCYIATIIMMVMKLFPQAVPKYILRLLPLYLLAVLFALLLTKTRSAWAGCGFFFVAYSLLFERKYLIYILLFACIALLIPEVQDRLIDTIEGHKTWDHGTMNSYIWRKQLWAAALKWMTPSHYFFGYGLDNFALNSTTFYDYSAVGGSPAHNIYLQLFFETGALGLLSYLFLQYSLLKQLWKYYKENKKFVLFSISLIIQYAFFAYSDNMFGYLAFNWMYWFALGVFASYLHCAKKVN